MPITATFEDNILEVDFSNLTADQNRLIKLAIAYPPQIIKPDGEVVDNPVPWQLFLLNSRLEEVRKSVINIMSQEIAAQAIADKQAEIDATTSI